MASSGQEQSQQEMIDQMSKELNYEKTAHNKVKHQLLCCIAETKSCMEQVEAASQGQYRVIHKFSDT